MDENTPAGWTVRDMQRADRVINAVERSVIGGPVPRKQRQIAIDDETGGGGSSGSSGCCCNEANCVDLCDAIDSDVVLACASCPNGAIRNMQAQIGSSVAFDGLEDDPLTGFTRVTWSTDCTWDSPTFIVDGGTYKISQITSADPPYWQVFHVSGTDPLKVTDGYHRIRWTYTGETADYSCLCNMQFKLEVGRVYKPKGLNSLICVMPLELGAPPPSCPTVHNEETDEDVVPCIEWFDFPSISGVSLCGFSGSTAVSVPLDYIIDLDRQCAKSGQVILRAESSPGAGDAIIVAVDIWYAGQEATLTFHCEGSSVPALYSSGGPWVIGDNVLTIVTPTAPFPTNVTVTLTDCNFSSSHPDTGYGCGGHYGSGGTGCDTDECFWTTLNDEDEATGPGPYHWVSSGGVGSECGDCGGCPEPEIEATEGGTATTTCLGA